MLSPGACGRPFSSYHAFTCLHTAPEQMCGMLVRRRMPSWDAYNRFALVLLVCEQVDTSDKENKDQCYQGFACGEKGEVCLCLPAAV